MQDINISQQREEKSGWTFGVEIKNDSSTKHTVTVSRNDHQRIAPGHSPEELVWASFLFLLDHESKESILSSFDLMDIAKYFPEYEKKIQKYL